MTYRHDLLFRPVADGDRSIIKSILIDTFEAYQIDLPATYSFADVENIQATYLDTGGIFEVMTLDGELIGFFGLIPKDHRRILLQRLYLKAALRGKGHGHHLMQRAIAAARRLGYATMALETTSKFKEAIGLYKKYGFAHDSQAKVAPAHDVALLKVL